MLRLATRRVARPLASAVGRRSLCAPAETAPVLTEIRAEIESMKAQIAMKPDESLYTADSFDAALKSGKVDMSMLSSTLDTIDPAARKLAMKCVSDANMMAKTKESEEAIMADYDWSVWEKKGLDPETIAEVKAIMEKGIADEAAMLPELMKEQGIEELQKSVKDAFNGPDGFLEVRTPPPPPLPLYSSAPRLSLSNDSRRALTLTPPPLPSPQQMASKEEAAAKAGMATCLASMEKLEVDAVGLREVTIAEILEREPELREEIEEEIKNNNWGY